MKMTKLTVIDARKAIYPESQGFVVKSMTDTIEFTVGELISEEEMKRIIKRSYMTVKIVASR